MRWPARSSASPARWATTNAPPLHRQYTVTTMVDGEEARVVSDDPAEAYGLALLALLRSLA